jgi:hypothetical protein
MTEEEYSVSQPENGEIEFSVQHPSNSFQMPVKAARGLAKTILTVTESEEK